MKIYSLFEKYISYKDEIISINCCEFIDSFDAFEALEMYLYILSTHQWKSIKQIIINGDCEIHKYLERIGFLDVLDQMLWIKNNSPIYKPRNNPLEGIKLFSSKNEFYWINQSILDIFTQIWLSEDTSYLVLSSLWEIIDNSFFIISEGGKRVSDPYVYSWLKMMQKKDNSLLL